MREFLVQADGGSRGNPGPAGYGAVVIDAASGGTLVEVAEYIGVATNNVAEYRGLLAGLKAARELDPAASVHVRMDSKLVVEQMSGRWKIKHPDLRPLAREAATVLPASQVTYEWIPREQNKHADRLANEAMDAGRRGEQWSPSASTADLDLDLDDVDLDLDARTAHPAPLASLAHPASPAPLAHPAPPVSAAPPGDATAGAAKARAAAAGARGETDPDRRPVSSAPARPSSVTSASDRPSSVTSASDRPSSVTSASDRPSVSSAPAPSPDSSSPGGAAAASGADPAATSASGGSDAPLAPERATATPAPEQAASGAVPPGGTAGSPGAPPFRRGAAKAQADLRAARNVATSAAAPDLGAPATFVLLRHGETSLTPEKRFSGSGGSDPALSGVGRYQAQRVAAALAARGTVQAIVSSPLARCRETAGVVAARLGLQVSVEDGLRETDFGAWEGLTFSEVRERYPEDLNAWLGSPEARPTGGGESFGAVAQRVAAARDGLVAAYAGRTVLIVSHVTPIKTLVRLVLGAPPESLFRMELSAASLSAVAYYADGNASLRLLNDTSHLR